MPVSKKRRKKRSKPTGPPLSKKVIAAKKRKLTRRQIFIYVFSALLILSFALSFIIGFGGRGSSSGQAGGVNTPSGSDSVLVTPAPGQDDTTAEDASGTQTPIPSESDTEN